MALPSSDYAMKAQFTEDIQTLAVTTTTANTTPTVGYYLLYADAELRWKMGKGATAAVVATSNPLPAKTFFGPVYFDGTDVDNIGAIVASGTATLELIGIR